jgi:hypothetical protein
MKKLLVITTILMLAMAYTALAEWEIIKDKDKNEEVVDVHFNNNDIELEDTSQTLIKAVNQTNAVDSAAAVSTNITKVDGTPIDNVAVNQANIATVENYNPSESESSFKSKVTDVRDYYYTGSQGKIEGGSKTASSWNDWDDKSCTYTKTETLDIDGDASGMLDCETKSEECEGVYQASLDVDGDRIISGECGEFAWESGEETTSSSSGSENTASTTEESISLETEGEFTSTRKNLSENNHIDLEDYSQKDLMAVSNLNTVGSGAAVQTNIASNVGVQGAISHSNTATVSNGM